MFANIAHHKSWRDQHSGKSSPDSYRYSSSLGSQVALDTPSSEPVTPVEAPLLVLPKRRGQNAKSSAKPHIRNKSREERSSTSIDLSRSSIELEGLGIYTNLERDTRFHQSVSNLHRSISQVSSSPSITRLGQTYVHPRRQLPTAASTPQNIGQRHSVDERYFTSVNRSLTAIGSTALSIPDDDSAATDDDNNHAANSPEEAETPVTASIDFRHSSPIILQRAHTDTAISGGISSSWTPSEQLSSTAELASHAAAVRAARIAFAKKEATKARKIEEQQKKAQQRDERRHQRSVSHMIKSPPATTADKKLSELPQQQQQHHRRAISEAFPPRSSFTENDIAEENFNLGEGVTTTATTTTNTTTPIHLGPPKLPAATKHNWNKFLTWGKTRYYKAKRKVSIPISTTAAYR